MNYRVFIHTNPKQALGATVAAYALRRFSEHNDKFEVETIETQNHAFLQEHDHRKYLRDGVMRDWLDDDLQSFTPLRFIVPELMEYSGRAVVMDPDIFAVADIWPLLTHDMLGKAIMCRRRSGPKGVIDRCYASSVMLLDCAQLEHWHCEQQFRAMFAAELDYHDWICLKTEAPETIGFFANQWNDFDHLDDATKLVHCTRRKTQPWKTGLKVDWRPAERFRLLPPVGWLMRMRRQIFGEYAFLGHYKAHPDPNQQDLFFGLLQECLDHEIVSTALIEREMAADHLRHDALDVLARTPPLAEQVFTRDDSSPLKLDSSVQA
jgi:hypothetical protein